jgi:hypothetical protein
MLMRLQPIGPVPKPTPVSIEQLSPEEQLAYTCVISSEPYTTMRTSHSYSKCVDAIVPSDGLQDLFAKVVDGDYGILHFILSN